MAHGNHLGGERGMTASSTAKIDLARFTRAVLEGLSVRALAERFGIHSPSAARWRRKVLAQEEGAK